MLRSYVIKIYFSWGYLFLCRVYIVGMGARAVRALLRGVVIGNMKILDFLDLS